MVFLFSFNFMLLCFVSSHAKEMENKQFWKVFYEHLERAAAYAGKSQLLNGILSNPANCE